MLQIPLCEEHRLLGAKMAPFAGWEMPLLYTSAVEEHLAVRAHVGLFDVSHMARIGLRGANAERLLDFLSTNSIANLKVGRARYTTWCLESGGCLDDGIVYRDGEESFFIVVNAGRRAADLSHFSHWAKEWGVHLQMHFQEEGILALQGPAAGALLQRCFGELPQLAPFSFCSLPFQGGELILSATGYTGAGGCEFYLDKSLLKPLWKQLLSSGEPLGIVPVGLAARDSLRLEMGYPLYGHELSEEISPLESFVAWTLHLQKDQFLGKESLCHLRDSGNARQPLACVMESALPPRQGALLFSGMQQVGVVTSGGFSPLLKRGIALALLDAGIDQEAELTIEIRGKHHPIQRTTPPFISNSFKLDI